MTLSILRDLGSPIRPVLPLLEDRAHVLEQDEQVARVGWSRHETKPLVEGSRVVVLSVHSDRTDAGDVGRLERP